MSEAGAVPVPDRAAPFEAHIEWARATPVDGFDLSPIDDRCIEDPRPGTTWCWRGSWWAAVAARSWTWGRVAARSTPRSRPCRRALRRPRAGPRTSLSPDGASNPGRGRPAGGEQQGRGLMLPFLDGRFAVVLDRHEEFDAAEVLRVLEPGGVFLTQQVDSRDGIRVNTALGAELPWDPDDVTIEGATAELAEAGFVIDVAREHVGTRHFHDLSSLLWYLKVIAWQVRRSPTCRPRRSPGTRRRCAPCTCTSRRATSSWTRRPASSWWRASRSEVRSPAPTAWPSSVTAGPAEGASARDPRSVVGPLASGRGEARGPVDPPPVALDDCATPAGSWWSHD
ncbi:hypothetical protein NKG05_12260 [Oerskovia sp. M15]